jgi:hypothetical protein
MRSLDEFEDPPHEPLGDDLDLASERPKGATMRGSALATFLAATVITTAIGLGGSAAVASAGRPDPLQPRFAFTSVAWAVGPTDASDSSAPVLSRPLPESVSGLLGRTGRSASSMVSSLGNALADAKAAVASHAHQLQPSRASTPVPARARPAGPQPKSEPALPGRSQPAAQVDASKPPTAIEPASDRAPQPLPEDDLLSNLPGIEALEATERRIEATPRAEAPPPVTPHADPPPVQVQAEAEPEEPAGDPADATATEPKPAAATAVGPA